MSLHVLSAVPAGKFDQGFWRLLNTEQHWLDVPESVDYNLGVTMFRYLRDQGAK